MPPLRPRRWERDGTRAVRILVVNYEYPPLGGGGGVLSRTLVAELTRHHEVTVLTSRGPGTPAESFDDGANVIRVPVVGRNDLARASFASLLSFVPAARMRGRTLTDRSRPDVVHTFFAVPSGPAGAAIARRAGAAHVLTLTGADVHDPSRRLSPESFDPLRRVVSKVVREADEVTAVSRDLARRAERLTRRGNIDVVHNTVVPPVLPPANRRTLGWEGGRIVVLTVARLVARKDLEGLIRAVGAGNPRLLLEIVGEGPERGGLEALAAEAAPGRVRFTGAIDEHAKALRLASADAFALVSQHEAFGLVYLEAMHSGLPVVAGNEGGQTDFLSDGFNALLVPPGDVPALTGALDRLAADRGLRRRIGEAGRTAAKAFVPEQMARHYVRIYERAVAGRSRRATGSADP